MQQLAFYITWWLPKKWQALGVWTRIICTHSRTLTKGNEVLAFDLNILDQIYKNWQGACSEIHFSINWIYDVFVATFHSGDKIHCLKYS